MTDVSALIGLLVAALGGAGIGVFGRQLRGGL